MNDLAADHIYEIGRGYWERLSSLFAKSDPRGPPAVITFSGYDPSTFETNSTFPRQYLPFMAILVQRTLGRPFYHELFHTIGINRKEDVDLTLAEEITHSVVSVPRDVIVVASSELSQFRHLPHNDELYSLVSRFGMSEFECNMDEFLIPIGQMYLLGKYDAIDTHHILEVFAKKDQADRMSRRDLSLYLGIVPQIAGQLMVDLYEGDIEAMLKAHPLGELDGPALWNRYAKPLLTDHKIS